MCLGIPGKVLSVDGDGPMRTGRVSFSGLERDIGLAFVPEATPGDYVIVHVGHAISVLDQEAAERTLILLDEIEQENDCAKKEGSL